MDVLNYMRLFVEVARRKSFRAAADAMDMPNSTLSRNIAELEKIIGLRLLHRSTRKVELTAAGEVYFKRCQSIVEEALSAHQALRDVSERPIGTLRVSMTSDFAIGYLAPILGEFARIYPQIKFNFDITVRPVDLQTEPIDLAIRMGRPPAGPNSLVVRQIATLPRYLYAAPDYLARAPRLVHASDLAHHSLCVGRGAARETDIWRRLHRGGETVEVMGGSRFVSNSAEVNRAMAASGIGIAGLDPRIVRQDVEAGRLVRVLPDWQLEPTHVHAITDTRHLPARTKLFIGFLMEQLGNQISIAQEDPETADAQLLMDELSGVLAQITGCSGKASFDVADVKGDTACFAVARNLQGVPIGCGAFRPLQPGVAEVKRMYARPGNAGTGRAILAFLEREAAARGYRALWLETREVNRRAVNFYTAAGYRPMENYGKYAGNPLALCFAKALGASAGIVFGDQPS